MTDLYEMILIFKNIHGEKMSRKYARISYEWLFVLLYYEKF